MWQGSRTDVLSNRKKQITYKISKWGLHKNTTSNSERQRLVEGGSLGDGVKVNPEKLRRWERKVREERSRSKDGYSGSGSHGECMSFLNRRVLTI